MEFTDRLMAMDRSVANYRRFSHASNEDATLNMLVDLLHWHGRFADFNFTLEKAHDMLLEALNAFQAEFEAEKEAANPLRGEREPRRPLRRVERIHDEVIYDPEALVPLPEVQPAPGFATLSWATVEYPTEEEDIEF